MVLHVTDGMHLFDEALLDYVRKGSVSVLQSFFQKDNSHTTDYSGSTLLHYAAESNNVSMTQYFLDNKYDIDCKDDHGDTPLMLAIRNCSVDTAKLLIKTGADIYFQDSEGQSILPNRSNFILTSRVLLNQDDRSKALPKYYELVKSILERVRKDCWNDEQLLLSKLSDIDCSIIQVIYLRDANVTKLMLDNGYPVNDSDRETKETALHEAVKLGDYQNVKVLLEYGADINVESKDEFTPICFFDEEFSNDVEEKIKILKILFEHGVLLTRQPGKKSPTEYILTVGKLWALKTLAQYGYEWDPYYSLYHLVYNTDPDALEILRGKKLDVNSLHNPLKCPVLSRASMFGQIKKVQFLLEAGADPNIVGNDGKTPFTTPFAHIFQHEKGHLSAVRLMLQYGANAQHLTEDGRTVFDIAIFRQHEDLLEPVIDHLAMMENLGETIIDLIRSQIASRDTFRIRFAIGKKALEEMKNIEIHENITLYKILTEDLSKINRYVRNPEFAEKFEQKMKIEESFFAKLPYYLIFIRKRVGKAISLVKLKKEAVIVMNQIIGHRIKDYDDMLSKIVDYINSDDLKNIYKVSNFDESELLKLDMFLLHDIV